MQAGKLDQRISIRRKTVSYNSYHEPIDTWAHVFYQWSEAITGGGGEFYAAQKQYAEINVVFRMRYDAVSSTISEIDRLVWGDGEYHILGINQSGGNKRELLITTKRVK